MESKLKNIKKELNKSCCKTYYYKYKYTLTYDNGESYTAYSDYDDNNNFCKRISSISCIFTNSNHSKVVFASSFMYQFNKLLLKPINIKVCNINYGQLMNEILCTVFSENSPFSFIGCESCICVNINEITLSDDSTDNITLSVEFVLNDDDLIKITNIIDLEKDNVYNTIINKRSISIINDNNFEEDCGFLSSFDYLTYADTANLAHLCNQLINEVTENRTLNSNIMINPEFSNSVMCLIDRWCHSQHEINVKRHNATLTVTVLTSNRSQILMTDEDKNDSFTYKCNISDDVSWYIGKCPELIVSVLEDMYYIGEETTAIFKECISKGNFSVSESSFESANATIIIDDLDSYLQLLKTEDVKWVDYNNDTEQ